MERGLSVLIELVIAFAMIDITKEQRVKSKSCLQNGTRCSVLPLVLLLTDLLVLEHALHLMLLLGAVFLGLQEVVGLVQVSVLGLVLVGGAHLQLVCHYVGL